MTRWLALSVVVLSAASAAAQPAPQGVTDVQSGQVVPVLVPCDEPSGPCPAGVARQPVLQPYPYPYPYPYAIAAVPKPPWQLHVSVSVTSGVLAMGSLFSDGLGPGAYLGGDIRFLWARVGSRWGLGLRLAGSKSLALNDRHDSFEASSADFGFLLETHGFWVTTGFSLGFYGDPDDHDGLLTLPEFLTGIGYDIALGSHLALRLSGSISTLIVTVRAQVGGGLVIRF